MHCMDRTLNAAALVLIAAAGIVGCETPSVPMDAGTDAPPTPTDAGRDAPRAVDAGPPPGLLDFELCPGQPDGGIFQCATLTVPVDYDDPSLGTIDLPVRRRPATDRLGRVGAIAWNPGGPGGTTYPGVPPVPYSSTMPSVGRTIGERFDLVSMDWRGVGASVPAIECDVSRATLLEMTSRFDVLEPMDLERTLDLFDRWIDDCVSHFDPAFLARVGSRNAARDLDRLRAGLGDSTINFWGFSYGTTLGATYATMFPERVRAFVLDSVSLTGPPTVTPDEIAALEARFDEFFVWCAGTASCAFARGRDAIELEATWRAIVAELDRYPVVIGDETVSGSSLRDRALDLRLDGRTSFPHLGESFADAEDGDYATFLDGPEMPATDPDGLAPFTAIRASDDGTPQLTPAEAADWLRHAFFPYDDRLARAFGGSTMVSVMWPIAPADGPPLAGPTSAPPMLIVGTTGDLATPYTNATSLLATLENGSHLLTYEGTRHAVSSVVPCLRDVVLAYLLDPTTPPATTRCVGTEP